MKNFILIFIFTFSLAYSFAQQASPYRIFGEITTVDNDVYRGYITWGNLKNYWIDFFEASKIENSYKNYFKRSDGVILKANNKEFAPAHNFCCRFGNIKSIWLTDVNEILLQLKNGDQLTLTKGNGADINTNIQISTSQKNIQLKWDRISEIHLMDADSNAIAPQIHQVAGIVKSSHGIYKGLIYWNYHPKQNPEKIENINIFLNKMEKIYRLQNARALHSSNLYALERGPKPCYANPSVLTTMENVMINMPNIGTVNVPWDKFDELTIIPMSELNLLSYNDFKMPKFIEGEVITRKDQTFTGTLAYDLDESYDFEVLDGKNNNITYRIPFCYIRSIEPKNYKYSFITLRNGSEISLGETCDVNKENNGIIVFRKSQSPVYIEWSEIKKVKLK